MRTVGVTGTNGKTTTTTWIAAALRSLGHPVACITTVGCSLDGEPVDVPRTHEGSREVARRADAAGGLWSAVEYTSEALARGYARLWPADVAVFTNLTHDHLDAHGSAEHYLASKAQLFLALPEGGVAVLNGRDEASALIAEVVPAHARVITYGVPSRGEAAMPIDHDARAVTLSWEGTTVDVGARTLRTRAIGEVFAENALAAWIAAIAAGADPDAAARAIADAAPPPGRFEVVRERPWVVVDYAHSPDALSRTLRAARALCSGSLHVVFGAGGNRDRDKRPAMGAAASIADRIWLTTDNPRDEDPADIARAVAAGIAPGCDVVEEPDRARAIERAIRAAEANDVIVLAGKGHERTQLIGGQAHPFDDAAIARAFDR
ncbi:MAG: UDP-N-acetylmuramyl-tripeptide synthetase [Deltaproteobacteria bacterium]|nr:UDP-N-acetylmuramyl-tripeptide synthetase [Deltaproteobacteria bacterium]